MTFAAIPVVTQPAQDCVVIGQVFNTQEQVGANLYSNCPLAIERRLRTLIMRGRHRHIEVLLPKISGVHEFVYRWGETTAQIDNQPVEISFGPAGDA